MILIGRNFGDNIKSQYRPAIIIQASIDHRYNIDSQHWLPTLRVWADHQPDHIFLHGFSRNFQRIQNPIESQIRYQFLWTSLQMNVTAVLVFDVQLLNHFNSLTTRDINLKCGTPMKQTDTFIRDDFHKNWSPIQYFMGFWIFWITS